MYRISFNTIALFFLLFTLPGTPAQAQDIGNPDCDRLLLISAYSANNVKIYDACDGNFIRNLDSNAYLQGPQAIAIDPQGDLVVVSETNGTVRLFINGEVMLRIEPFRRAMKWKAFDSDGAS